ncbi:MAG: hypothetical protein EXS50_02855 [Candidatus Taylorbacteria bacterium]|nr:hypothetical protein [Candidatus Taylorbacteria bacterium]
MKKTNIYFIPIFIFVFSSISFAQSTSCITLTKDLYVGLSDSSTQGEVSILQNFLKTKGYATSLSVTGFFGVGTQVAVQTFQSRSNIVSSGSPSSTGYGAVGALTRKKIKDISCGYITTTTGSPSAPSSPAQSGGGLTIGSRGTEVTKLQEFLISHGYVSLIPAGATGYFGGQTRAALAAFQIANGISPAVGYFGPITKAKVASMSGVSVPAIPCSNGALFSTLTGLSCTASPIPPIPPILPITPIPPVTPTPPTNLPSLPKCNDGIDNDGDAVIDYPYEPGCSSPTDSSESNDPLLLLQNNYDNSLWNIGYSLGGKKTYIVGDDFGDQTTGTVDLAELQSIIEGHSGYPAIPTSFNGYAVLDIEVPYLNWLRESASSQHFQYAQSEMLKALNLAKQLRPNAKWGYYDIPNFLIHFPGGSWADASESARASEIALVFQPIELINAVDFYAPSIYSPYPSASTAAYLVAKEKARNREAVKISIAHSNGKPVFTYISDRFWNSNPVYNYMAMPYQEFIEKQFIGMDYGADGVFLWGGDNYWYNLGYVFDPATLPAYALDSRLQIRAAWDQELPSGIDPHTYINAFQEQTLRITAQELFGTNYTPIWPLFNDVEETSEDGSKVGEPVAFLPNTLQQFAAVFMAVLRFLGF